MPMFYTPKPRQFHYQPRFYDPDKEDYEAIKRKYQKQEEMTQAGETDTERAETPEATATGVSEDELAYFQRKVKSIERQEQEKKRKLTVQDFFRKREKPQFHYISRFDENGNLKEATPVNQQENAVKKRITRRFGEDDLDRFEPIPASKIIIYTLLVCLLLFFIFSGN